MEIATEKDEILAAAFLTIQERPANSSFITGITGTLLNVITYPNFRKKGVSSIDLFATENGKSLYAKLGFSEPPYTAMRLKL